MQGDGLAFVAAGTVFLGFKGPIAIVAFAAELTGVDCAHFDFYRSLFHFGKHVGVVAFFTDGSSGFVDFTRKGDFAHGAFGKFQRAAGRNGDSRNTEAQKQNGG